MDRLTVLSRIDDAVRAADVRSVRTLLQVLLALERESLESVRSEALNEVLVKLEAVGPAHTYASENADLYRGFDNGVAHAIKLVNALKDSHG